MPAETAKLFLLEDLEQAAATGELAEGDLEALRATADWIRTFVVQPNQDLGRAGPVCPFVPRSSRSRARLTASVRRAAALPVGAARATRGARPGWSASTLSRAATVVVLPVPGPPAITLTELSAATAAASRW